MAIGRWSSRVRPGAGREPDVTAPRRRGVRRRRASLRRPAPVEAFFAPGGDEAVVRPEARLARALHADAGARLGGGGARRGPAGEGLLLRGEVRIPSPASAARSVLARLADGEHRLAWIDHGAPGVERRGSRTGGAARDGSPCWLALEGAAVGPDLVSRPVTPTPAPSSSGASKPTPASGPSPPRSSPARGSARCGAPPGSTATRGRPSAPRRRWPWTSPGWRSRRS